MSWIQNFTWSTGSSLVHWSNWYLSQWFQYSDRNALMRVYMWEYRQTSQVALLVKKGKGKSLSRVRLCDPRDCSPPGSSIHGIFQARVLEWVPSPWQRVALSWTLSGILVTLEFTLSLVITYLCYCAWQVPKNLLEPGIWMQFWQHSHTI